MNPPTSDSNTPQARQLRPAGFPIICGPTAGGKSSLAVALAHSLKDHHGIAAEIVTADAFQIYRGMGIGTAKPTLAQRQGIPHHLIDIVDPADPFTVEQWLSRANVLIEGLRDRGILPILVGGTHLYIKALLEGLFQGPPPDPALRALLYALPPAERRNELERVDPAAALKIHPADHRRTVRALEVFRQTGRPISAHQRQWDTGSHRTDALLVVLNWPADELARRINARVKQMVAAGLPEEVLRLTQTTPLGLQAREALGYKQFLHSIQMQEGTATERSLQARATVDLTGPAGDAVTEKIKIQTRRFAKNQRTWLKRLQSTPGALRLEGNRPEGDLVAAICLRLHLMQP